jgi:hypothetical protein
VADGQWTLEAKALSALHQLSFAHVEEISRDRAHWELALLPDGGQRLTMLVDRRDHVVRELDSLDAWARITSCDQLEWSRSLDGGVLRRARCGASNLADHRGPHRSYHAERRLVAVEPLAELPDWAAPAVRRQRPHAQHPVTLPIRDDRRIEVPVHLGHAPAVSLVLDTGAWHTVISPEVAHELGVVPTGEPPMYAEPPWLDDSEVWVGVVDTTRIGDFVVHGQRVLVADNPRMLYPVAGLLGCDFFRSLVLDVDTPAGELRLWERDGFRPPAKAVRIRTRGHVPSILGEVLDVGRGYLMLDTGMPDEAVINHPMMKWKHPRRRNADAFLGAGDSLTSPDYYATIDGLALGPFVFPRMTAIGRDRDGDQMGSGVGIVGMGLMR